MKEDKLLSKRVSIIDDNWGLNSFAAAFHSVYVCMIRLQTRDQQIQYRVSCQIIKMTHDIKRKFIGVDGTEHAELCKG